MQSINQTERSRILYIPHGGGPLPLLGDPGHRELVSFLKEIAAKIGTPDAIIIISAHWEESIVTITGGKAPRLIYDYYGFPPESYNIQYPAPGNPELAKEILALLQQDEIPSRMGDQRGFDHGVFVPLKLLYPAANIPCVQISQVRNLDPREHLRIGKALAPLRDKNILVLGSGFSFHNLREFFASPDGPDVLNESFQSWLIDSCTNPTLSGAERERLLIEWEKAPSARYCHPREEHLLPLHVCVGMGGSAATLAFDGRIFGKRSVAFLWH
jgi:4,5-DOPA dioxygenase extradiol